MTVAIFTDQATTCGFAVGWDPENLMVGEWDFSRTKHDAWAMTSIWLKQKLEETWLATGFTVLGYEKHYRHQGTDAAHLDGANVAAIQEWCLSHDIPYTAVGVGELKKSFTGRGNATKANMIAEAISRGHMVDTDNEADAVAGWYWLQALLARGDALVAAAEAAE